MSDPKPTRESLSKTPSWIMLGFVIGAVVALTVPQRWRDWLKPPPAAVPAPAPKAEPPAPKPPADHMALSDMEAIFEQWQDNAVWVHDVTQVAYWNPATNRYDRFVEVLRNGEDLYFRSIPKLTRPIVDQDINPEAPIRFTETEEMHARRPSRWIFAPNP